MILPTIETTTKTTSLTTKDTTTESTKRTPTIKFTGTTTGTTKGTANFEFLNQSNGTILLNTNQNHLLTDMRSSLIKKKCQNQETISSKYKHRNVPSSYLSLTTHCSQFRRKFKKF